MLTDEQMETVLISTSAAPTGHERLVIAFRDGDDLFIPLDSERPANADLLDAEQLYVREVHRQDNYEICSVAGHQQISAADRGRLEAHAHRPISETTEVLHVVIDHISLGAFDDEPPGFVAVIDGSERALGAVNPAIELSGWYGRPCGIVVVTGGEDDHDTELAVTLQLEDTGLDQSDVVSVPVADLDAFLFELMRQGQILVASAFGVWARDGRLPSRFSGLVQHNAPAIIGIGPNVMPDWKPDRDCPILVCVDASDHAHHMVDKLEPFLVPARARVVVAHIETADAADTTIAHEIADEIHHRFGMPVQAMSFKDESAAAGIAILASRIESQLVITHSWHRPQAGKPAVASTSLSSVAHAPCPVVILSD